MKIVEDYKISKVQLQMFDVPGKNLKELAKYYAKSELVIIRSMMQEIVDDENIRKNFLQYYLYKWNHIVVAENHFAGTNRGFDVDSELIDNFKDVLDIKPEKKVTKSGKLGSSLRALICFFYDKEIKLRSKIIRDLDLKLRSTDFYDKKLNVLDVRSINKNRALFIIDLKDHIAE